MLIERIENGPFLVNTYILACTETGKAVIVDPGHEVDRIVARMEALKDLTFEAIVNTHAHIDHVAGVETIKRRFALPFKLHRDEVFFLDTLEAGAKRFGLPPIERPDVDSFIGEGDLLTIGNLSATLRLAPGHSPGSLVIDLGNVMISGDVIFHGSIGRTDLGRGDLPTLLSSIRSVVLTKPDETEIHPGHGPATTVGRERRENPFLGVVRETRRSS